ncbi:TonB system transport protein ExbD [Helicobacter sp. MIT 11-5569]|uniref:TonB system transport protein ExbD n=1 Tax=Helicobacter sp. MIT 11-5569 TaxID=1548151 RepID=UPI00051F9BD4|nr:TonB system transport protein ExbD [Helicobacter sp. MIT 11-5569]TLD85232.1 TonB system transport protein ExbD [Helicobacter sp. MIT 11-5569]
MLKIQHSQGLNIVPFIDVILVLLAMVLSISTFIAHGEIKIELPKSDSSTKSSQDSNKLKIIINNENIFYIEDKEATLEEIAEKINALDRQTIVELKSDKNAKFDSFIRIIDILRNKNHENFQIITERNP